MLHMKKAYYSTMMAITELAGLEERANAYRFALGTVKVNIDVDAYRKQFHTA